MADPKKNTAVQPYTPQQPLFNLDDIVNSKSLVDATAAHANAVNSLSHQNAAINLDGMVQKADLLQTTTRTAQEIFKDNETQTRLLTTAQQRRSQIEKIPPLIGRIMGLFDKDYDWGYWNENVRSAKLNLAANSDKLSQLQMLSELEQSVINNQLAMTQMQYENISGTFDRALSVRQVMAQEEQRSFENRLKLNQEARASAQHEMTKIQFEQSQELAALSRLDEEALQLAADGKVPGVNKGLAQQELLARNSNKQSLANAQLAYQQGNLDLASKYRSEFMARNSAEDLTTFAEAAKANNGRLTIGGVEFTQKELSKAAASAATEEVETQKAVIDRITMVQSIQPNVDATMETALRLSNATGSVGINPMAQRILSTTLPQVQQLVEQGDTASLLAAGEISQQALADMDKLAADTIKRYPDKQRTFVEDQFDGRKSSPQAVTDFIGDMIFNPEALSSAVDAKIAPLMRVLGDNAKSLQSISLEAISKTGKIPTEVTNRGQIVQTALGNTIGDGPNGPGLRTKFMDSRDYEAYMIAVNDLSKQVPWLRGITSLQQFSDPANPGNFDSGLFYKYLRDKYIADVEAGLIPVGGSIDQVAVQPYDKQLLRYMQRPEFQEKLAQSWSNFTIEGRALMQAIHGGDPLLGYMENLINDERLFEAAYAAEKSAVNNMTSPDLSAFRRQYAAEIGARQHQIMSADPGIKQAAARAQAESDVYKQVQGTKTQILQRQNY